MVEMAHRIHVMRHDPVETGSDEDNSVILRSLQTAVINNNYITVILLFLAYINNLQTCY